MKREKTDSGATVSFVDLVTAMEIFETDGDTYKE